MFGVLKPALAHVSAESQQRYHSTYCNLCASLSASGAGVWNRLFLINDVVTIDWLLTEDDTAEPHAFSCHNCLKGGAIGKTRLVSTHQAFLAAVSTFVCGIKINDNAIDNPKWINKSFARLYQPMMRRAEAVLQERRVLNKIKDYLARDREQELQGNTDVEKACQPTEACYELLIIEGAKARSTLPYPLLQRLGQYLGRCVYLLDAIDDMEKDHKKGQYNVLNLQRGTEATPSKAAVVQTCLELLKPLRLTINEQFALLADALKTTPLHAKWNSLFISIENQLLTLIKPLNNKGLLMILSSFSSAKACPTCSRLPIQLGNDVNASGNCFTGSCLCKCCCPFGGDDAGGGCCSFGGDDAGGGCCPFGGGDSGGGCCSGSSPCKCCCPCCCCCG